MYKLRQFGTCMLQSITLETVYIVLFYRHGKVIVLKKVYNFLPAKNINMATHANRVNAEFITSFPAVGGFKSYFNFL